MVNIFRFTAAALAAGIFLGGGAQAARNVRIVDFGSDLGSGDLMYRGKSPERKIPYAPEMGGDPRHATGQTFVSAWPFSLETPLNAPGLRYDTSQKNAVFYGGLVTLTINNPERGLSEGHPNANHEFRDDLNFMALQGGAFKPGEEIEAYAFWFWKKADFLNGGDKNPVGFDRGSRISVHVSRYWGGVHAGRWVVREGDAFYVSEKTFGDIYKQFTSEDKENPIVHRTQTLAPTETKWAHWEPKAPYSLAFDRSKADFQSRDFRDVTAVGFLLTRELSPATKAVPGGLSPNQPIAVKWYAFRCDAVVGGGSLPSGIIPATDIGGLSVGTGEVTFEQWEKVRKIAATNQYCRDLGDLGYAFRGDGSMGSMRADDSPHRQNEPVTDIAWIDAAAWCNALSELEGLEPAYYTDPEYKSVFRRVFDRDHTGGAMPSLYWKPDAPGYRLPTPSEWASLAGSDGNIVPGAEGLSTISSDKLPPGPRGLAGISGNVWEYTWPGTGNSVDPEKLASVAVMGGDYSGSAEPEKLNPGFAEESPFEKGSFNIGFRTVRGPAQKPPDHTPLVPTWTIAKGTKIPPGKNGDPAAIRSFVEKHLPLVPVPDAGLANAEDFVDPLALQERNTSRAKALDDKFLGRGDGKKAPAEEAPAARKPYTLQLGKTEVPFGVWNRVKGWAEGKGYRFNYPGDMGSMRLLGPTPAEFDPSEPVTFISWYDAVAWNNALSELLGLRPSYYTDADKKQVFREVSPFRLETYAGKGYPNPAWKKNLPPGATVDTSLNTLVFFDATSGGFRLPLYDEFRAVESLGGDQQEWTAQNSGGRTHPAGSLPAGASGVQDIAGNVLEWGWDPAATHTNSMVDYRLNGSAYFFEQPEPPKGNKAFFKEYTGAARPFVGLRVAKGSPE